MSVENLPGLEIDAIAENADGTWGAFEIKLGIGAADTSTNPIHTSSMKSE